MGSHIGGTAESYIEELRRLQSQGNMSVTRRPGKMLLQWLENGLEAWNSRNKLQGT
jgi:hypothetical protein